jgi:hypothetical protein
MLCRPMALLATVLFRATSFYSFLGHFSDGIAVFLDELPSIRVNEKSSGFKRSVARHGASPLFPG